MPSFRVIKTVDLSLDGTGITTSDFTLSDTTITIPNGQLSGSVTLTIQDDLVVEATETALVTISNPSAGLILGATIEQDVTITDNDSATFTIDDVSVNEDAGTLDFVVSLDNPVDIALSVDVSFAGGDATPTTDYDAATRTINFPVVGTGGQTVSIPIVNDGDVELDETFIASLSLASTIGDRQVNATDTAVGTILNDDSVTVDANLVIEGAAVSRSAVNEIEIKFTGLVQFQGGDANADEAFALTNTSQSLPVGDFTAAVDNSSGVTVVTLRNFSGDSTTAGGSLADGRYSLTVFADNGTRGVIGLDGNGDGTPGDDAVFTDAFFRLFGDSNGDGAVDGNDLRDFRTAFRSRLGEANYDPAFDFDDDGDVDLKDMLALRRNAQSNPL